MKHTQMIWRLFLLAAVLALYATKTALPKWAGGAPAASKTKSYETVTASEPARAEVADVTEAEPSNESEIDGDTASEPKIKIKARTAPEAAAIAPMDNGDDPTAALAFLTDEEPQAKKPRFVFVRGVRLDMNEIDLLVETEITAGTIKSPKAISAYRTKLIERRAQQIRENLAQGSKRARLPSSTKK